LNRYLCSRILFFLLFMVGMKVFSGVYVAVVLWAGPVGAQEIPVDTAFGREALWDAGSGCRSDMACEEAAFLRSMPAGLQKRQERAVREAMSGNTEALNAVRRARNVPPDYPAGIEVTEIGDTYRLYRPSGAARRKLPVLMYLHGGGWCFGSLNSCARFCAQLAREAGVAVLAVDYPLAPEAPYPAALNACAEALGMIDRRAEEWGIDRCRVSVGGDSAGGNLALALALRENALCGQTANGRMDPAIRSLVLFYPVVKCWAEDNEYWRKYGEGFGLDASLMEAFNEAYAGQTNRREPLLSPACATDEQLAALPPTLIVSAGHDILCGQGAEFAGRLAALGVAVKRFELVSASHLFITVPGQSEAFRAAVRLTAGFMNGEEP